MLNIVSAFRKTVLTFKKNTKYKKKYKNSMREKAKKLASPNLFESLV